ncbi:expressed unknown protein [Seminavis robusta]|uniref:Uncharacterized protein n=1 Tax=Seminavis robusta TaxID=568900 RepID=A0A9N8HY69_9STRA|nr:expressed unknown protein [Seminavis robusta]|eukprot:Sro2402_g326350.1 n/a (477) ;mRNA; f:8226-9656
MQNEGDFEKLKKSDPSYFKLELFFDAAKIGTTDWFDLRSAIEENKVVREVHIRITKEFCDGFPLGEIVKLFEAIGSLQKLKYVCLGQMQGAVQVFGQVPLQAVKALLAKGGDKVVWWLTRGMILTHIYKGSEEEAEDKGDKSLDVSDHNKTRKEAKESKKKKEKKSKKESSKKDKKKDAKRESITVKSSSDGTLDKKQLAAKRCLEKLGDVLVELKSLKRVSLMGHFDETLQGCSLDPLLEGMSALGEAALEILFIAMTRHEGKVLCEPSTLGHFLDNAVQLKECSILYMELTDDHIDEVGSNITKLKTLQELMLSGATPPDNSVSAESIGALFRAPHLTKLCLPELALDTRNTLAMCMNMVKYHNIKHLEIMCGLAGLELLALQQMLINNEGLETLHIHVQELDAVTAPLDLVTSSFANSKSKLKTIKLETKDENEKAKKMRDCNIQEWAEVIEGLFKVDSAPSLDAHCITLTKL